MKSVRGLGAFSIIVLVGSGISALLGLIGLAICLAALSLILVLGITHVIERRRHADHRQVVHGLELVRSQLEANNNALMRVQKQHADSFDLAFQEIKALQKQHSNSLGLTFREIRSLRKQHEDSSNLAFQEIKALQKQHSNSLGLTFREIKALSAQFSGDDPLLEVYAERQLATYLNALRITKRELSEAVAAASMAANNDMGQGR